jgi:hypothetical protein
MVQQWPLALSTRFRRKKGPSLGPVMFTTTAEASVGAAGRQAAQVRRTGKCGQAPVRARCSLSCEPALTAPAGRIGRQKAGAWAAAAGC